MPCEKPQERGTGLPRDPSVRRFTGAPPGKTYAPAGDCPRERWTPMFDGKWACTRRREAHYHNPLEAIGTLCG